MISRSPHVGRQGATDFRLPKTDKVNDDLWRSGRSSRFVERLMIGYDHSLPIGSMVLLYMVTFTIKIPQMLAYIPYMDPMGYSLSIHHLYIHFKALPSYAMAGPPSQSRTVFLRICCGSTCSAGYMWYLLASVQ